MLNCMAFDHGLRVCLFTLMLTSQMSPLIRNSKTGFADLGNMQYILGLIYTSNTKLLQYSHSCTPPYISTNTCCTVKV